jgi:hypothetical protein
MAWKIRNNKAKRGKLAKLIPRLVYKADPTCTTILEMKHAQNKIYAKWVSGDGSLKTQIWMECDPKAGFSITGDAIPT